MSDDAKLDNEESKQPSEDKSVESRRKFTKAGLGGGAVLMSLLSRPALGTNYANAPGCTASVMASVSAGTSLQHDISTCRFGCTVFFWCEEAPAIAWTSAGALAGTSTNFNLTFPCQNGGLTWMGGSPSLLDVLLEKFDQKNKGFLNIAARQTVAAWLNAGILNSGPDSYFEWTQTEIREGYCQRYDDWKGAPNRDAKRSAKAALTAWGARMEEFNNRNCPIPDFDDQTNMFYYPKW